MAFRGDIRADKEAMYTWWTRRIYLFLLFILLTVLFLLIFLWRRDGQDLSTTFISNITQSASQLAAQDSASSLAEQADLSLVTFEQIDRSVWSQAFTFGEVLTANTYNSYLDGLYVKPPDSPAAGDIFGSYVAGFTVNPDAVALGTDTTGNYVASLAAGNGLTGAGSGEGAAVILTVGDGDGILVADDSISVQLATGGGLAFSGGGLTLLDDCTDGQLLVWNDVSDAWTCGNDATGGGSLVVEEQDGAPSVSSANALSFGPASSSSEEFIVSDLGVGEANVRLGTAVPLANAVATITGSWTFSSEIVANGGVSCSNCIALGAETTGNYIAGISAGSGISVSGSGSEGATATVGLDSSLAMFKTIDATLGTDPVADSLTDTLQLSSGDGVSVTGDSTTDAIAFAVVLGSGSGLDFSDGDLTMQPCSANEVLKYIASAWTCATDTDTDTNTTYSAGSGLTLTGTTFSLDTANANNWTGIQTFSNGFTLGGNTYTNLVGTGLSFSGGTLSSTLGISIDSTEIVDGTIATADIADEAITSSLILDGTIVAADIANGTITLDKIAQNGCTTSQIIQWNGSAWACASLASASNIFQTVAGDTGSAAADSTADTITLAGGDGITATAGDTPDTVTFDLALASGSGLAFASGALTLSQCSDGQILKRVSSAWTCSSDSAASTRAYRQHLEGADDVSLNSSLRPLLTNGSGTASGLSITITSGNEVAVTGTLEVATSLAAGPLTYSVIRDDNGDNDCATGGGDGTLIGGTLTTQLATVAQKFTTSLSFIDTSPSSTTVSYQLCASTSIALGTVSVTDRSLSLEEVSL
ncbi:MAG TPA: hypothetical protein VIS56_02420 [Candidatus Saccharimonadales bacterium]